MAPKLKERSESAVPFNGTSNNQSYTNSNLEIPQENAQAISMRPSQDVQDLELGQDATRQHELVNVPSSGRHYYQHNNDESEDPIMSDASWLDAGPVPQRRNRMGTRDLVLRKPLRRVRRTCHVCSTEFVRCSKQCSKCQHVRCTDCPRDPPKLNKYPFGYPGDAFGPNSTPYYECVKCWTLYARDAEEGTPCTRCGEQKSDSSPRAKPRAVDQEFDPSLLRKLEAQLDELDARETDVFLPC